MTKMTKLNLSIPMPIKKMVRDGAVKAGLPESLYLISLVLKDQGKPTPPRIQLYHLAGNLARGYGKNFPMDVTRCIFREIQNLHMDLYNQATNNQDPKQKHVINRQLGKTVMQVLEATKRGRDDGPLDPDELIESYTLLIP